MASWLALIQPPGSDKLKPRHVGILTDQTLFSLSIHASRPRRRAKSPLPSVANLKSFKLTPSLSKWCVSCSPLATNHGILLSTVTPIFYSREQPLAIDLLNPSAEHEKRSHKLKRLVQSPNSYFMDVKCPGA